MVLLLMLILQIGSYNTAILIYNVFWKSKIQVEDKNIDTFYGWDQAII